MQYAARCFTARCPYIEATVTIEPLPVVTMCRPAACAPKNTPSTFTSITRRHSVPRVLQRKLPGTRPGAAHPAVQSAKLVDRQFDQRLLVVVRCNIDDPRHRPPPQVLNLTRRSFASPSRDDIAQRQVGPSAAAASAQGPPDPRGAPSDSDDAIREPHARIPIHSVPAIRRSA